MDRREAIADAAIEVLAMEGSRGLSHRAIDNHLGIATGSVSYYYRSRQALIAAAAARLVELDQADIDMATFDLDGLCALVEKWLAAPNRARLVARFELFLMSSRASEGNPLATARQSMIKNLARSLEESASPNHSTVAAIGLIATIEGLLLDAIVGSPLHAAERRQLLSRAVDP